MKKLFIIILCITFFISCTNDTQDLSFKGKNVRIVIGSTSTGGDTYAVAELVSRYLSKELDANLKVDPVGAARALETITTTRPDGNTIMIFHDMTYLGSLFGTFDEKYALENMIVGPRAARNPGAAWAASKSAPYNTMTEIPEYLIANPEETIRFALEAGSVSHVGFAAYYNWVLGSYGEDVAGRIRVILGGSTGDKLQLLWDGNCDVIFADYSSLLDYVKTDDPKLALKYVGLLDNISGVDVPSYSDLGITFNGEAFAFTKEYLIFLPKDFPQKLIDELDSAVEKVCSNKDFQADLERLNYSSEYLNSSDAKDFLYNKREVMTPVIESSPNLDSLVY